MVYVDISWYGPNVEMEKYWKPSVKLSQRAG